MKFDYALLSDRKTIGIAPMFTLRQGDHVRTDDCHWLKVFHVVTLDQDCEYAVILKQALRFKRIARAFRGNCTVHFTNEDFEGGQKDENQEVYKGIL